MFVAIYSFEVKLGCEETFLAAWAELTELIYQYRGSLGSRMHRQANGLFVAYAQWPSRVSWEDTGPSEHAILPGEGDGPRAAMRASCEKIETLYELEVVDDHLREAPPHQDRSDDSV